MKEKPDAGLRRYRAKRDFDATPEPAGKQTRGPPSELSFVVQKHAARRLHYDFRLELDGTLKSWAVPKGPSLDPTQRRMAVHVEDHPLEYAEFEGTIPAGHYGAGEVIVWDRGTWTPIGNAAAGYREGKLKFMLHGRKLTGAWTLVRMKPRESERQESWLLIKEHDAAARSTAEFDVVAVQPDSVLAAATPDLPRAAKPAPLPTTFKPGLATLVDAQPTGDWRYEIKFDGYRLLARIDGTDVRLVTRNGNDWTARMPDLVAALRALRLAPAWLDGEIVVLGERGVPDFQALQNAFDRGRRALGAVCYFLFDLPFYGGHDLRAAPLVERRALLRTLIDTPADSPLRFSEDFAPGDADILDAACEMQLEGVIGKRADSTYPLGRSRQWIKLKCSRRQEFVVGGWTDPQGTRAAFGSLLLGVFDDAGTLHYAGNVGSGFDAARLGRVKARLDALAAARSPFAERVPYRNAHWVKPELVAEVAFSEWTQEGRVRHPVFKGLRDDKPAASIRRETPTAPAPAPDPPRTPSAGSVRVTNPDRIIDAASGATKRELVDYYARVAALMLPHLAGRPLALLRAPDGIAGQTFFQKHAEGRQLPGVKTLDAAFDPGHGAPLGIDDAAGLLGAAQMNVVEFHTWNARAPDTEHPDRMVFDLDPGEGVAWPQVVEAALLVQALLDELGLRSFAKSSGGKGLHVVVPLTPRDDWDFVKAFSHAVVRHLAAHLRQRFVAKSGPRNRVGRIFVDYLRNGRGATTASAYSARARPGLPISLPLSWDELPALDAAEIATIRTPFARLAVAAEHWRAYARTRQTLAHAASILGPEAATA